MANERLRPEHIADHVRRVLKDGGSAPHAEDVQRFFKEDVKSRGWYTAELRKVAVRFRRTLLREKGLRFLIEVADQLFSGHVLEEKALAVFLLEKLVKEFGDAEFERFATWLDRITSWADHDALVHYLVAPMVVAQPKRISQVFRWAKSRDPWHRRAACVALIQGTRQRMFFPEVKRVTAMLLTDEDDMVQKGLG
jgi:3-methyladenine DNA glycosylase AlkD